MTSTVPIPADSQPDDVSSFRIRVSQDAAPLLEFILVDAGLRWRDLVREEVDATVVIETPRAHRDHAILALRQRLGGNMTELR